MDEFSFIKAIKPKYYKQSSVVKGIGDDGAIIQPSYNQRLVIATDTMVEKIHFSLEYMSFEDIGYRVLAANLSDLAAMGSRPLYYMVNMSSSDRFSNKELLRIMNGMKELADIYNMDLIGGDTTSSNELVITVTVFGQVDQNKKRLRSVANLGDAVFVTGHLGESGYGLKLLQSGIQQHNNHFVKKHIRPKPRIDFVKATDKFKRLCLNDVSDGLSSELSEIAEASNVSMLINWDDIPVHLGMTHLKGFELEKLVLSAGEDFQLVGTCSQSDWSQIQESCLDAGIKVSKIGEVLNKDQEPTVYINKNGTKSRLDSQGYQHGKRKGD